MGYWDDILARTPYSAQQNVLALAERERLRQQEDSRNVSNEPAPVSCATCYYDEDGCCTNSHPGGCNMGELYSPIECLDLNEVPF